MNKKGMGIVESIILISVIATLLACGGSSLHAKQRAEKQLTAEGRAEYPIIVKEAPHMTADGWSTTIK